MIPQASVQASLEVASIDDLLQTTIVTLMNAFVEASTKTSSTKASVAASVEATSTEGYGLLPWKLEEKIKQL